MECVNVLKNKVNNGWGSVGDEIVVVVKKARPISAATQASVNAVKVRRGDVRRAVIVRTRKAVRRPDGTYVRFDDNAAVLLNNKREMLGTRIGGIVNGDLRLKGWGKLVSLAPRVSPRNSRLTTQFSIFWRPGYMISTALILFSFSTFNNIPLHLTSLHQHLINRTIPSTDMGCF